MTNLEKRLKAIALFDGWKYSKELPEYNKQSYPAFYKILQDGNRIYIDAADTEYHTSYDWLMPVVKKIQKTEIEGYLNHYRNCIVSFSIYGEIIDLFEFISDFCIEWCNENNIKLD
jgi:hypothetical protein